MKWTRLKDQQPENVETVLWGYTDTDDGELIFYALSGNVTHHAALDDKDETPIWWAYINPPDGVIARVV